MRFTNRLAEQKMHHQFRMYEPESDESDLIAELAATVRELYVDVEDLGGDMRKALDGLGDVADVTRLAGLIDEVVESTVPSPDANPQQPPQLNLTRNELAEILAYEVTAEVHSAIIPARRVREKEIPGQPARGLDLLSIISQDPMQLLVTEVKASESLASPPAVVCDGDDCLRRQTLSILGDRSRLIQELNWAYKHCRQSDRQLVASALVQVTLQRIHLVAAPILVRSTASYARDDFGCFEIDPDEFAPANVDFVILRLPRPIQELAGDVYREAARGQPNDSD